MSIPKGEPDIIYAGDTLKFTKRISSDYPPATWTLSYRLVKDGELISITASDNGDGTFLVNVAPAITDDWEPGDYDWQATVTDGTDRYTVGQGRFQVRVDFAQQESGYDPRSVVKRTLDQIEETLLDQSAKNVQSYSVGDRALSKMTITELLELREKYRAWYQQELNAARIEQGLGTKTRVLTRFVNPS